MMSLSGVKKQFAVALFISTVIFMSIWHNDKLLRVGSSKQLKLLKRTKSHVCFVEFKDNRSYFNNDEDLQMIYIVTPTYPRPEQIPELTRLANTLMHVPRLHWIVADDQTLCSLDIFNILQRSRLPFTHISSPKPFKPTTGNNFPRGVANRLAALTWLRKNVKKGILYFGDDDNTMDLQLFDEIRKTKKVSMLPVGLIGDFGVSAPVVHNGKVTGFFDSWPASRTFPVDMAGFAVNIEYVNASANMPYSAGYEEDKFLQSLGFKIDDIEPLANNCTRVLVWHTRTYKYKKPNIRLDLNKIKGNPNYESVVYLLNEISRLGMANINPHTGNTPYITRKGRPYEML